MGRGGAELGKERALKKPDPDSKKSIDKSKITERKRKNTKRKTTTQNSKQYKKYPKKGAGIAQAIFRIYTENKKTEN